MATILDSSTLIFCLGCQSSTHQGGGKVGDLTIQGVNVHLHFLFAVRLSVCPHLFRVQSLSLWTSLNLQSLEAVGGWGGGQSCDCMKSGTESGDLGATHNVFQIVLLFSLPSEGPVTQTAGFFQDSLGENSFCGYLCCRFKFRLFLGFKVSCNLPFSSQFLLTSILHRHLLSRSLWPCGCEPLLFLACILVRFWQGEGKNGCVGASKQAAWLLGFHTYLVQLFRQRHGIVYFPYRCFCTVLKWKLLY